MLDFRTGTLDRELHWRSTYGREVKIRTRRLVSFTQRSTAAIEYEIEAVDQPMRIALQSNLVANLPVEEGEKDPRKGKDLGAVLEGRLARGFELRAVLVPHDQELRAHLRGRDGARHRRRAATTWTPPSTSRTTSPA